MTAVRPSRTSSPVRLSSLSRMMPLVAAVAVDEGGQRGAEAFLVHAAFGRVDGVGEVWTEEE